MKKLEQENFILGFQIDDDELLNGLIEYHKNNEEYKFRSDAGGWDKETKWSVDVGILSNSQNKFVKSYLKHLQKGVSVYNQQYEHFNSELVINEGFNIQYYPPNGGYYKWHNERDEHQSHQRSLVFMTYLNDVPDGGGTEFAYYPEVKIKAKKGLSLIWPTDFTHTHRGIVSQHEKWIITGWFNHQGVKETKATIKEKIQADFDSGRLKQT
tara:strand:- start:53 stop:685 length:633 start_codon:yes stop_codon:yes gene_type:complete